MIKTRTAIRSAFAAIGFALLGASAVPATAATSISVQIGPPPAPHYEAVPAARRGQAWIPGHWEWRHNHHEWVSGYFVRARPGYYYAQPTYVQHGNRWDYRPGYWARNGREGRGDRDHDGVANRYDRHPGDPYRR